MEAHLNGFTVHRRYPVASSRLVDRASWFGVQR